MSVDLEVQIRNLFDEIQAGQAPVTIDEAEQTSATDLDGPGSARREQTQRGWVIGLVAAAVSLALPWSVCGTWLWMRRSISRIASRYWLRWARAPGPSLFMRLAVA